MRPFEMSLWKAASYAISTRLSFLTIRDPFVSLSPNAFRKRGPVHLRSAITGKIGSPVTIRQPQARGDIPRAYSPGHSRSRRPQFAQPLNLQNFIAQLC
jgi:hypothetical protein